MKQPLSSTGWCLTERKVKWLISNNQFGFSTDMFW